MNQVLDQDDRRKALDAFAARPSDDTTSIVPSQVFAAPAERVFGAQPVAVKRDEGAILQKLRVMAAAAGEKWYYRFPVKKKVKNETTGKDEWVTDYIEGASIKCANNVSRLYGNCDIDTRVFDVGAQYFFYARFMDLETGYSLTRPFKQRKSQKAMRTDADRADDIVFQIGASKAIRNVITNALEFFTDFAWNEAKNSIIEKVGQKLDFYRARVLERLAEMKIDVRHVETVRGRAAKDWLATDIARTIAEIQAINDGMATIEETYFGFDPDTGEVRTGPNSEPPASTASGAPSESVEPSQADAGKAAPAASEQQTASGPDKAGSAKAGHPSGDAAGHQPAARTDSSATNSKASTQPTDAPTGTVASGQAALSSGTSNPPKEAVQGADGAAAGSQTDASNMTAPKNEAEYIRYSDAWIAALTDAGEGETRWKTEKTLRNKANVGSDAREAQQEKLAKKCAEIRDADRS